MTIKEKIKTELLRIFKETTEQEISPTDSVYSIIHGAGDGHQNSLILEFLNKAGRRFDVNLIYNFAKEAGTDKMTIDFIVEEVLRQLWQKFLKKYGEKLSSAVRGGIAIIITEEIQRGLIATSLCEAFAVFSPNKTKMRISVNSAVIFESLGEAKDISESLFGSVSILKLEE